MCSWSLVCFQQLCKKQKLAYEGAVKPLICRPNVPSMSKRKQEPPLPMPFQLPANLNPSLTAAMELQHPPGPSQVQSNSSGG